MTDTTPDLGGGPVPDSRRRREAVPGAGHGHRLGRLRRRGRRSRFDPESTPFEDAVEVFDRYHGPPAGPSPDRDRWAQRRAINPDRFDRFALELDYAARGLAISVVNGSGDHDEDVRRYSAESAELARRLAVLADGPLTETRWRRHSEPPGRVLFHWQSIRQPPWYPITYEHDGQTGTIVDVTIDEGIADLIESVWAAGLRTQWSCQDTRGMAYITFGDAGSERSPPCSPRAGPGSRATARSTSPQG